MVKARRARSVLETTPAQEYQVRQIHQRYGAIK